MRMGTGHNELRTAGHRWMRVDVMHVMKGLTRVWIPLVLVAMSMRPQVVSGQCTSTIATFPYQEGFETVPAWTSGGTGNDWAWGTPAHTNINGAGSGNRAWCVGGLTGSFYTYGQQSWIEGPCFNFSGVDNPWISFKIFWECERVYDGLAVQYSLNAGTTWTLLGEYDGPQDCLNANWYNTASITNLNLVNPKNGWSGRIGATQGSCSGGAGSEGWLTASQCMPELAGASSVKFRFAFGSGTQCNDYDGIAIDDIFIGEAPANSASFTYACDGNEVSFTNTAPLCPTSYAWDFGDPASGAGNTSSLADPTHTFSVPGTYFVTLTVSGPCNAPSTTTVQISVLAVEFITTDPECGASDGSIIALVEGTSSPLTIIWSPGGQNTAALTNIPGGVYGVTITATNACTLDTTVSLGTSTSPITLTGTSSPTLCTGAATGEATVTVTGGTAPYSYAWSPTGGDEAVADGLPAGTYTCTVTDAALCTASTTVTIVDVPPLSVVAPNDTTVCPGDALLPDPEAVGGTPAYTFTWSPEEPVAAPAITTTYTVVAVDQNGCISPPDDYIVTVGEGVLPVFTWTDSTGCAPHCVTFTDLTVGDGERVWDLGDGTTAEGVSVTHCYAEAGSYSVTLTVQSGSVCDGALTVPDLVHAWPLPQASFETTPTFATLADATFRFRNTSSLASSYLWSFGEGTDSTSSALNAEFMYSDVGCYEVGLLITSDAGCSDSTSLLVCVEDEFAAYVPNAFTPNGDGFNDLFGVLTTVGAPRSFELDVFDRWGRIVFAATDQLQLWDGTVNGTPLPPEVFAWRLRMIDTEGETQERLGHVTLVR